MATAVSATTCAEENLKAHAVIYAGTFQLDDVSMQNYLSGPVVTQDYLVPGIYDVTLEVRDNALQSDSDATTTITIVDGAPPVADTCGPNTAELGSIVVFNGTGSTDETAIEQYAWKFGEFTGGPGNANVEYPGQGASPIHFDKQVGTYVVELTVTDNTGKNHTDTTTVEVVVGSPPVANAGGPYRAAVAGPPAYLNAMASSDDYGIVEYRWDMDASTDRDADGDFINDIDAVGMRPFHVFNQLTIGEFPGRDR